MSAIRVRTPPRVVHIVLVASSFTGEHTTVPGARCRCRPAEAIAIGEPQARFIVHGDGPTELVDVPLFVRLTEGEG